MCVYRDIIIPTGYDLAKDYCATTNLPNLLYQHTLHMIVLHAAYLRPSPALLLIYLIYQIYLIYLIYRSLAHPGSS